jgi:hypothetical protein
MVSLLPDLGFAVGAHSIIAAVCSYLQDFAASEQKLHNKIRKGLFNQRYLLPLFL